MAIACFLLVTFFPLRPLFSFPCFMAFISVSTFLDAAGKNTSESISSLSF